MANALPLAAAAVRLRGRPGRPRKQRPAGAGARPQLTTASVAPIAPRLLDLPSGSKYIGVKERKFRELVATGIIPRVRVPDVGGGEVRKLLVDRQELDRLIESWREVPAR